MSGSGDKCPELWYVLDLELKAAGLGLRETVLEPELEERLRED